MIAYFLIVVGLITRLFITVPNLAPVATIGLFSATYLQKRTSLLVPLSIMILSDAVIGMHDMILFTWGGFVLAGSVGFLIRRKRTFTTITLGAILSSVIFFVISNFGAWLFYYPLSLDGLTACYVNAIPFFRNSLAGNLVFAFVLFGSYETARYFLRDNKYATLLVPVQIGD